ncbi:DUF998 domain-containing protein [Pyrodictium abyssi]|uniref:DUF998 domain-containing protein n=1 Tax=Pyrodictium abyssi TaxID=54256 RepID=A0ABM8IXS1_9CREN|nr:DUF998 domain-containing protein [Pyrodictium abyssi]
MYCQRGASEHLVALALAVTVLPWLVITVSWSLNPWFDPLRGAYSDLGSPGARYPWVFNLGMIVSGALVVALGIVVYRVSVSRLEAAGAALLSEAGVFLALVGLFPEGTRPHSFVATWFFLQLYASYVVLGVALRRRGLAEGLALAAVGALAVPLAGLVEFLVGWPSVAVLETYAVLAADVGAVLLATAYRRAQGPCS